MSSSPQTRCSRVLRWLQQRIPSVDQLQNQWWLRHLQPWLKQPALWQIQRHGVAAGMAIGVFFGLLVPLGQMPLAAGACIVLRAHLPTALVSTFVSNPVTYAPLYYLSWRVGSILLREDTGLPPPAAPASTTPAPARGASDPAAELLPLTAGGTAGAPVEHGIGTAPPERATASGTVPIMTAAAGVAATSAVRQDMAPSGWRQFGEEVTRIGKPLMAGAAFLAALCSAITYLAVSLLWRLRDWLMARRPAALRRGARPAPGAEAAPADVAGRDPAAIARTTTAQAPPERRSRD